MKKIICLAMSAALVLGTLCGCGKKENETGGEKIRIWMPLTAAVSTLSKSQGDTPLAKALAKETGVEAEFIHPSNASLAEQFNLLTASDDMPDVVQYFWNTYPGGTSKAVSDGVILDLNTVSDKIPNYLKYLNEHKQIRALSETVKGELPFFSFVRGDDSLLVSQGIAMRKDWLDDLGLEVPETIDEFENVLRRFKNEKGAQAPLFANLAAFKVGFFVGAYNTTFGFYNDNGTIKYGPLDPQFKDFVILMNKWCKEGLLNSESFNLDTAKQDSNLLNGTTGASHMSIGGGIGKYLTAAPDDKYDLVGVPNPVLKKGTINEFGACESAVPNIAQAYTAVSAETDKLDSVLKYLDFGYSEKGHMLYNFGIEGESYNMVDGYPKYVDKITNNPDGYAMNVMLGQYTCSYSGGPFVQDKRYMEQYGGKPQQQSAWKTWENTNAKNHNLPSLTMYFEGDEQQEYAVLYNSVNTYIGEKITKLILGTEPISNYDSMIAELKNRGIDRAIEINQNAYNRYLEKLK